MIYLDYAAATPMSAKAKNAMEPYLAADFFNPSAPYLAAKKVRDAYESAKDRIAHVIGAKGNDIIMTAGATEANNIALAGASHILYLVTEHDSVRNIARTRKGEAISVEKNGIIDLKDFVSKLTDDVDMVSVSLANNELGSIQPIVEISEIIKKTRLSRLERGVKTPLYLHSDASQALNLISISVARMGIDLLTINAAKVYGPKGVGALYAAHGVKLKPLTLGGGQENGLRSGTENVAGTVAFAEAISDAHEHLNGNRKKYEKLSEIMRKEFLNCDVEPIFLGNRKKQLANFVPVCFPGIDAERIIFKLEEQEIYLSTGAACAASKGEKSHVLKAIGLSDSEINGSLRISLGEGNTEENVIAAAKAICQAVNEEYARING